MLAMAGESPASEGSEPNLGKRSAVEIFGREWTSAWQDALNNSREYQEAARWWSGRLVLVADPEEDTPEQRVFLDLEDGTCRMARPGQPEDEAQAEFVIRGERSQWLATLDGRLDPVYALMRGRLRLSKGMLSKLLPNADAARALVRLARSISD